MNLIDPGDDFVILSTSEEPSLNVIEDPRVEKAWYHRYFVHNGHTNFVGKSHHFGKHAAAAVVVVSIVQEHVLGVGVQYRVIVWRAEGLKYYCIGEDDVKKHTWGRVSFRAVLQEVDSELAHHWTSFHQVDDPKIVEDLCYIEGQPSHTLKAGVVYIKEGQTEENDFFANVEGSRRYNEFLAIIGTTVRLKDYDGYNAQLDVKGDLSGEFSVATLFQDYEVMFHVSTMLPLSDEQQVQKKRHIGNDIVCIVFHEGSDPYVAGSITSHFIHVLIVVSPDKKRGFYRVETAIKKSVPLFGPEGKATYSKADLKSFLLTKCINGSYATCQSPEFQARERRTIMGNLDLLFDRFMADSTQAWRSDLKHVLKSGGNMAEHAQQLPTRKHVWEHVPVAIVPGQVRSVTTADEGSFIVGTTKGIVLVRAEAQGNTPHEMRINASDVTSVEVIRSGPEMMCMIAKRANDAEQHVLYCSWEAALCTHKATSPLLELSVVDKSAKASMFAMGEVGGRLFLVVVVGHYAYLHKWSLSVWRLLERVPLAKSPRSCTLTPHGFILAIKTAFYHLDPTASKAAAVKLPLHCHTVGEAVAVTSFRGDGRMMLLFSFTRHAVLSDGLEESNTSVQLEWPMPPLHMGIAYPYCMAVHTTLLEVYSLLSGTLLESHPLVDVREDVAFGDILPLVVTGNDEKSTLYAIAPKEDVASAAPSPVPSLTRATSTEDFHDGWTAAVEVRFPGVIKELHRLRLASLHRAQHRHSVACIRLHEQRDLADASTRPPDPYWSD